MGIPKIPPDMLRTLRRVVWHEHVGGFAPQDYQEYRRLQSLQRRRLVKYFDRKRARWDQTFYLATGSGHREIANAGE